MTRDELDALWDLLAKLLEDSFADAEAAVDANNDAQGNDALLELEEEINDLMLQAFNAESAGDTNNEERFLREAIDLLLGRTAQNEADILDALIGGQNANNMAGPIILLKEQLIGLNKKIRDLQNLRSQRRREG